MFSSFKQGKRRKGGRSSSWHKQLLDNWNNNPRCYWCGNVTVISKNRSHIKGLPPLEATLDHVYSNYDLRRLLKGGSKTVVACNMCNNKRAAAETRLVYPNSYDKRNNRISIIKLLQSLPDCNVSKYPTRTQKEQNNNNQEENIK